MTTPNSAGLDNPKDHNKKEDPPRGTDGAKAVEVTPTTSDSGNSRDNQGHHHKRHPGKES